MARRPARKSAPSSPAETTAAPAGERDKIIAAFLALLAEKPIEQIGLSEISSTGRRVAFALRGAFSSPLSILAAHIKDTDRAVLAEDSSDMAEEPIRERLFNVLMRRLEALAPHRQAVRSLLRSARRDAPLRLGAQRACCAVAEMDARRRRDQCMGPRGALRAQGLVLLFGSVLRTWVRDDDPGLARTMAALDRALARGQRFSGFLDDLCYIPSRLCRLRSAPRRRRYRSQFREVGRGVSGPPHRSSRPHRKQSVADISLWLSVSSRFFRYCGSSAAGSFASPP